MEIHVRMGPLAAWLNRRDTAAVRQYMREEGANLKRIPKTELAERDGTDAA